MTTVAQCWAETLEQSGLAALLPPAVVMSHMLMFYSGFTACIQATMELAELPEGQAMAQLQAMHIELHQAQATAMRVVSGGTVQ